VSAKLLADSLPERARLALGKWKPGAALDSVDVAFMAARPADRDWPFRPVLASLRARGLATPNLAGPLGKSTLTPMGEAVAEAVRSTHPIGDNQ